MATRSGLFWRIWKRASTLSIFARIVIGNSIILFAGAIGGTWITHIFTEQGFEWFSLAIFVILGIGISILLNVWIVRAALRPFFELHRYFSGLVPTTSPGVDFALTNPDPDTVQLANSLATMIDQLEASNRRLRVLSGKVIKAHEDERMRIARSLHDDTGQALLTLKLNLEQTEGQLSGADPAVLRKVQHTRDLVDGILKELRTIIYGLRPSILDDLGLGAAIRWYAKSQLEVVGIDPVLDVNEVEPPVIISETKITLFRIAQEAINNIVRHAQAQRVWVTLACNDGKLCLRIEDDGCGFDMTSQHEADLESLRWGLVGIQERTQLIGGECTISSRPDFGTEIEVQIPLINSMEVDNGTHSSSTGR